MARDNVPNKYFPNATHSLTELSQYLTNEKTLESETLHRGSNYCVDVQ